MYKKLLSFFTLLVVLCMGTTAKAATSNTQSDEEESPVMPFEEYLSQRGLHERYVVTTAAEFLNHWKQNHSIAIAADIDLSGFTKSDHQIDTFTGELCSYDPDGVKRYKLTNIPETMAQHMTNAYIHDICFEDSRPKWDGGLIDNARGTSLVARYGKNCRVDNVVFRNVHVVGKDVINTSSYGAIIFSNDEGSTFINIEAYDCTVFVNSNYAAILCAKSEGSNFYRCLVMTTCGVYSNGEYANDGYAGAIAGYAKDAKFTECNSLCSVSSGKDGIGGIVGHGENCTFSMCNNYGSVTQKTIGSAEALENASKQMGAMTVTGSKSFDQLVNAGQDNGLGSLYGLTNQVEAFTSITMLERSFAQTYANWQASLNAVESANTTANTFNANLKKEFWHWRSENIHKILKTGTLEQAGEELCTNYNWDKFLETNGISPAKLQELPAKPTKVAHGRAISNVLRGVGIALGVYQIWSQIYDELDSDEVGGIVGYLDGGSISRCANYGFVYCTDVSSGGIAGEAHNVNITNCLNQGLVQGYGMTGGIVGFIEGGSLQTSLNVGNVSNGNSSNTSFGRIYGQASGATISHNFFSGNVDRSSEDAQVAEVPLKMLATGEVAMMLNQHAGGGSTWRQSLGLDYYPNLAPASDEVVASNPDISPTICTKYASDFLTGIMNQYSNIELEGDIELNTSLANFSSQLMPFQGSIDGHGHRLKNLSYVANEQRKSYWWWSNDNENKNVGLFSFARNATFKNLELCDFNLIIAARTNTCGLLVGNSTNCTYENIHLTGHSTIQGQKPTFRAGGLVGSSKNDTFTGCTTGSLCQIDGATSMWITEDDVEAGGLVGVAVGSNFTNCINRAAVKSNNDYTGGIVANIKDGKLERCVNLGGISGCEYLGGIAGYAEDTEIYMCANTGLVNCVATVQESEVGGIVGRFAKDNGNKALYECANWGNVYRSDGKNQGAIYGDTSGSPSVHDNYYCFVTEEGDHPEGSFGQEYVLSGEWTINYNNNHSGTYYQDIDNNLFGTHYPVPVEAAGVVYHIRNCKGTDSWKYSNRYMTSIPHSQDPDKFGICKTCGSVYEAPQDIEILDGFDLVDLAYATNNGQNFTNSTIHVERDIDMSKVNRTNNHNPIGTAEHPFSGTFDGKCHTISNLVVEEPSTTPGLFGTVTGNTTIRNLIMDNTCALRSTGWGAGGFVGCSRGTTDLNLTNLGFEGFVSGNKNVGAVLGGTFSIEGATVNVTIDHCYNTGTVKGDTESASLCGYAASACVLYSWNAGKVTGYTEDYPIIRGKCDIMQSSYDINATGNNHITAEDVTSGQLAYYVNNKTSGWGSDASTTSGWYQQIGVDEHPTFIRNTDHAVYRHNYTWCDAPETTLAYYDNAPLPEVGTTVVKHDFDEKGFCMRKEGELHGEECPVVDNCWKVTKIGHLYNIAEQVNSGKEQHDINQQADLVDNYSVYSNGALSTDTEGFHQWTPIGNESNPFTKSFHGNNHTISGLYVNPTKLTTLAGLFGNIQGNASISNVGITDSYFNNAMYVGAIAGYVKSDENGYPCISGCYASDGAVNASIAGGGIAGVYGIDGSSSADFITPITHCYNTCSVLGNGQNIGGILGASQNTTGQTLTTNTYYLDGCTEGTAGYGEAKPALAFRTGDVCKLLNNGQNGVWSQALDMQQAPVFGDGKVSYSRTVTADNWGSLILPFPVTSDDDVQYYTFKYFTGQGSSLHLEKASTVPANTPCFFKTSTGTLSAQAAANSVETPESSLIKIKKTKQGTFDMYLIGSYIDLTVSPVLYMNFYVAQNKLWWGEEAFTLPAFRAYIQMCDTGSHAKSLDIVVDEDGETTQIGEIRDGKLNMFDGKYMENGRIVIKKGDKKYNLNGQKII